MCKKQCRQKAKKLKKYTIKKVPRPEQCIFYIYIHIYIQGVVVVYGYYIDEKKGGKKIILIENVEKTINNKLCGSSILITRPLLHARQQRRCHHYHAALSIFLVYARGEKKYL